jgi:hypothetical protein
MINKDYKWDNYSDKHLNVLGNRNWLEDNVDEIVKYINANTSIKHIYFTFKSENWLIHKREVIIAKTKWNSAGSIFTPTGMGFRKNLAGFGNRSSSLANCWVWNGLSCQTQVNKHGYIHLDHEWLKSKGVNVLNF